ncbi:hypothetical protein HNP48_002243 [Acidovorax soli]|uniref:Uncharacterized protein n=1 Tax=Acidovorax soli TaxID=592050 RepID=A0A7X0U8X1_9BURK|nr:hypothetical protein [Acidovorax soli]MBB6559576.1 hypothetical protein [Acidovorax soli]
MAEQTHAMGAAIEFVSNKINSLDLAAAKYGAALSAALSAMGNIKVGDVATPQIMNAPAVPLPPMNLGTAPTYSPGALRRPIAPAEPDISSLLAALDVGDMDELPPAPAAISLTLPDAPSMRVIPPPVRPNIDTSVELPATPTLTVPEMEGLEKLSIPDFVFPTLPDFDGVPPSASHITVPNVFINWAEPKYASEIYDDLLARIKTMMAGGTGLPPAIEDALFARARERDSSETARAVQEAVDTWAGRNFSMPPGMLAKSVSVVREQGRLKAAETNRDILIEAAKWEIENIRFAVQQGMALEQLTANIFENAAKRMFEVARFQAESQINVFNAQIGLFNAQNSAFQTLAQVYRTRLDGALARLTAYKTAVDGQVALGQINQQRVEVFKAKLAGVQASVELFTALMRGAQTRADVIKNQFDAYRADVQAFAEEVGAEKVKFDAYEAQVKGEVAKAGMLDSQARAYASTIQGLANKADIRVKGAQLKLEAARVHITKYLADVDGFKAELDASLKEMQYGTAVYQANIEGWKAKASANVAAAEVQSRFADMNARTNIAFAEMQISQYQANINKAVQQAQVALEAAKAMGQYSAQLAAGAMSAMHVSASVSGSGSQSESMTTSTSNTTSTNHNYSY